MGASTAFHLTQLGVTDVVLCERETLGSGSTSKSAGGIRTQFADELNVRIALRSLAEFEAMEEIDFRQHGYLFLLDDDAVRGVVGPYRVEATGPPGRARRMILIAAAIVTVPVHGSKDLRPGTQNSIMRTAGLTDDDV